MEHPLTVLSWLPHEAFAKYSHVLMLTIVMVVIVCIGLLTRRLTKQIPGKTQVAFEGLVGYLYDLGESVMGHEGRKYIPFIIGIGFYVVISNLIGLIPGFMPPTMNMNTTAAPAVCVFLLYQYIGIKTHGAKYIKHFLGPIPPFAPLMFLIELVSHLARPLSLTMRLFGNVTGEEIVLAILFMLVPFLVPLPMYFLAVFTGVLQSFVFMLLTMVYISGALEDAH
jgi:F-type H+-transporting ATPase subunit a